jgi:hypothetical protein
MWTASAEILEGADASTWSGIPGPKRVYQEKLRGATSLSRPVAVQIAASQNPAQNMFGGTNSAGFTQNITLDVKGSDPRFSTR